MNLASEGTVRAGMVRIDSPELVARLFGIDRQESANVEDPAPTFLLARYEVTNREFEEFVNAGAYRN